MIAIWGNIVYSNKQYVWQKCLAEIFSGDLGPKSIVITFVAERKVKGIM